MGFIHTKLNTPLHNVEPPVCTPKTNAVLVEPLALDWNVVNDDVIPIYCVPQLVSAAVVLFHILISLVDALHAQPHVISNLLEAHCILTLS